MDLRSPYLFHPGTPQKPETFGWSGGSLCRKALGGLTGVSGLTRRRCRCAPGLLGWDPRDGSRLTLGTPRGAPMVIRWGCCGTPFRMVYGTSSKMPGLFYGIWNGGGVILTIYRTSPGMILQVPLWIKTTWPPPDAKAENTTSYDMSFMLSILNIFRLGNHCFQQVGCTIIDGISIYWVGPLPSISHHQCYYIFIPESL